MLADLARAIADGAGVVSGFRVMGDQRELFGLIASVPACWRPLNEIAAGGSRPLARITAGVNAARHRAWAAAAARHGTLPGIRIADKTLEQVTCIRLDASMVTAHSDNKELAEPDFKGFGHHPLLAYCDNTRAAKRRRRNHFSGNAPRASAGLWSRRGRGGNEGKRESESR